MNASHSVFRLGLLGAAAFVALSGCARETGVSDRHLHGVVTLPPVPVWEAEESPRPDADEDRNDVIAQTEGPITVSYGYYAIHGVANPPCEAIEYDGGDDPDYTAPQTDCSVTIFEDADVDLYRIRVDFLGVLTLKRELEPGLSGADLDMEVLDPITGDVLDSQGNEGVEYDLDGDGEADLDDNGDPILGPPLEHEIDLPCSPGDEFVVAIRVNGTPVNAAGDEVEAAYQLILAGNDPREHNVTMGIEGGSNTEVEIPLGEEIRADALDIKVGAFLNNDSEDLGNPVAGTTCVDWTLDEDTYTFWCAWDMVLAHQVEVQSNVLVEPREEGYIGVDNDCDGTADTGTEDTDADGDGVRVSEGDCNDTDPTVHPFRGDEFGNRRDDDCDGWADNGPDDVDNDGDGYCENGIDADGDGFCRGRIETRGGLGRGDCNDNDPTIYPGLSGVEIASNSIDDDCDGVDAVVGLAEDADGDGGTVTGTDGVPEVSDAEERACGSSTSDPNDRPIYLDDDDLCDYNCLGRANCPYDNDADGHHNYLELLCGSDPDDAASAPDDDTHDPDRDGFCTVTEQLCGSDPALRFDTADPTDLRARPASVPKRGFCQPPSGGNCIGEVGCAWDEDGDGVHTGDELVCGSDPLDAGSVPTDSDGDGWCDQREVFGDSDEDSDVSVPNDLDGDGLPDVLSCLGEVGCPQDNDGDGFHNWTEINCGTDPDVADMALPDTDGDGTCDGQDDDADGDGFTNAIQGSGNDCNDTDPNIHPLVIDEDTGEPVKEIYDVVNGIDDDCDGIIDENFTWSRDGDSWVQDSSYDILDEDGDGFTLALRDCDDTNPLMRLGNYETRSTNVVIDDFTRVWLFAGDVASLNSTQAQSNARRSDDLVSYDLEKERVTWTMVEDWEAGNPPALFPQGLPIIEADFARQPEVGKIWFEARDSAGDEVWAGVEINGFSAPPAPFDDGTFQELGEAAAKEKTNELHGKIDDIVRDTWSGDNDAYHVTFPEAGFLNVTLDWDTAGGDYDALLSCYFFNAVNPPNFYNIPFDGTGLTSLAKPETGTTIVPLPDGADCWVVVVGYSGSPGAYTLTMTPAGN